MNIFPPPEIEEFDFGDGDIAACVTLSITPFGETEFFAPDTSDDSKLLLRELIGAWGDLWPEMLEKLQDGMEGYEVGIKLGADEFIGSSQRTKPGYFMSDESDSYLRLEFDEPPLWDYYLRESKIVHFQPVF